MLLKLLAGRSSCELGGSQTQPSEGYLSSTVRLKTAKHMLTQRSALFIADQIYGHSEKCSFTDGMSVIGHALIRVCGLQVVPNKSPRPEAPALHLQRKRKADAVDDHAERRDAKRAHSLYQTSIAAPLRRARRRLLCMSKVGLPASIWLVMTAALAPMKTYHLNCPAAILLNHDTCSALAALHTCELEPSTRVAAESEDCCRQ